MKNETGEVLKKHLGDRLQTNKDLSPYFTLKMHTQAEYYFEAETIEDWQQARIVTAEYDIPLFVLGGGSNTAVLQQTIPGLVVRNRYITKEVVDETDNFVDMLFSSGYPMSLVVKETVEAGLSGFEYHMGLPGTLGGAIYMNSKWTKPLSYIGDTLLIGKLLDIEGSVRVECLEYFAFAYDYSKLQDTREIFLDGVFRLMKHDPAELKTRAAEALAYRKETQPFGVATGGCFFQNISEEQKEKKGLETSSAGYLIDKAGLKGKKIGAFEVSQKHANFIINTGKGKPEDLDALLKLIKRTIKEQFDVDLDEEVRLVS